MNWKENSIAMIPQNICRTLNRARSLRALKRVSTIAPPDVVLNRMEVRTGVWDFVQS